ncbi:MAG: hypothetical protein C0391_05375 [Anaerolinea sp.]|nr:hypothetical protein [Anaerolinea sp.]
MKKGLAFILVMFLLTACGHSADDLQRQFAQTLTAIPPAIHTRVVTQIVQVQITVPPRIVEKVKIEYKVVTVTPPGPASTPMPTQKLDKIPGTYLIGSEIAPGNWRSMGSGDGCYWKVSDNRGEIVNNYFGVAGTIMYIPASGYIVQLESECGNWTYLGN